MADDPNPLVRRSIVHVLCDGSPTIYETRILGVLERLRIDADERVSKPARRVLAAHRHSGTLNAL